jgi:hypothetical protein
MTEIDGSGLLRIISNARIFNLTTLVPDLENIFGQGRVSFIQNGPTVIVTIKTDDLAGLSKVYKEMGLTISTEKKS